jgi:low molecular weight protein-tyrosine phosphatase
MAAALLQARLARRSRCPPIQVLSAGFGPSGYPATDSAVAAMDDVGIDITRHRSRQLDGEILEDADLVLGMTRQHVVDAVVLAPEAWPRTLPLVDAVRRASETGPLTTGEDPQSWVARLHGGRRPADVLTLPPGDDIADPIGGRLDAYRKTRDQLDGLTRQLAELLCASDGDTAGMKPSRS